MLLAGAQQRQVSPAMSLIVSRERADQETTQRDTRPRSVHEYDCKN
jgi:hypothetical protein